MCGLGMEGREGEGGGGGGDGGGSWEALMTLMSFIHNKSSGRSPNSSLTRS